MSSIYDRVNRNQTYIAGDWDGDKDAIDQLKAWNASNHWALNFYDVHELTQARDTSRNCSIKRSLDARMRITKKFVLVVGNGTITRRAGSCQYCPMSNMIHCILGHPYDTRSYIQYECEKAFQDCKSGDLEIVVLYNSMLVNKNNCPEILRNVGTHIPMITRNAEGIRVWDYNAIKKAIMDKHKSDATSRVRNS